MANESQSDSATDSTETVDQGTTDTDQAAADETSKDQATDTSPKTEDDDPGKRALLADLKGERTKRQALSAEVETLKAQLAETSASKGELEKLQSRYSRLEEFITSLGGPLSAALDSKSFTASLFETDTDIDKLVSDWHKKHPSATSTALSSSAAAPSAAKPTMNDLLRSAVK